jgi:hypothetical protein
MAELSKADFESRYNNATSGLFKTGQTRGIASEDLRDLIEYLVDSVLFTEDSPDTALSRINSGAINLLVNVVDIGDWNMDSTGFVDVAHGIADISTIVDISAVIFSDGNAAVCFKYLYFIKNPPPGKQCVLKKKKLRNIKI